MAQQDGLKVALHPLPLLSISDQATRVAINTANPHARVFGALLGTQQGRQVDIMNSFECVVQPDNDDRTRDFEVDHAYFVTRRDQFKQVFPTFDFLGWYTVGDSTGPAEVAVHKQFLHYNETPLFLHLSPPSTPHTTKDLPIVIYESVVEIVDNEPTPVFVPVPYEIETGEAERVAVDHVSKGVEGGQEGASSSLLAALTTQRSALSMLSDRISQILSYLQAVASGTARSDPETLRQIAALVASLPGEAESETPTLGKEDKGMGKGKEKATERDAGEGKGTGQGEGGGALEEEFLTEYNDVLLTNYLATLTKQLSTANELLDKQLLVVSSSGPGGEGGRSGGGGGGGGMRTGGGGGAGNAGAGGGRKSRHAGEGY
ncbi:hypothetical protein JCM11641_003098 [Rhodosporidiobolus odoratus]